MAPRSWGETRAGASRLRVIGLQKGGARTVTEVPWILSHPQARPKRAQILYRQADEALWLVNSDGAQDRKLPLAGGRIGPARWSPDGRTVLYLNFPDDPTQLHALRECSPDQNTDKLVARTSQFAHFGCNTNTSGFRRGQPEPRRAAYPDPAAADPPRAVAVRAPRQQSGNGGADLFRRQPADLL